MSDRMSREQLDRAVAILQAARDRAIAEGDEIMAANYRASIARISQARHTLYPSAPEQVQSVEYDPQWRGWLDS